MLLMYLKFNFVQNLGCKIVISVEYICIWERGNFQWNVELIQKDRIPVKISFLVFRVQCTRYDFLGALHPLRLNARYQCIHRDIIALNAFIAISLPSMHSSRYHCPRISKRNLIQCLTDLCWAFGIREWRAWIMRLWKAWHIEKIRCSCD
jgi:hypothetical protein